MVDIFLIRRLIRSCWCLEFSFWWSPLSEAIFRAWLMVVLAECMVELMNNGYWCIYLIFHSNLNSFPHDELNVLVTCADFSFDCWVGLLDAGPRWFLVIIPHFQAHIPPSCMIKTLGLWPSDPCDRMQLRTPFSGHAPLLAHFS